MSDHELCTLVEERVLPSPIDDSREQDPGRRHRDLPDARDGGAVRAEWLDRAPDAHRPGRDRAADGDERQDVLEVIDRAEVQIGGAPVAASSRRDRRIDRQRTDERVAELSQLDQRRHDHVASSGV